MSENTTWMWQAACRGEDPELWQPEGESDRYAEQISKAKEICSTCPVVLNCYAHILANPTEVGIWGGTTELERAELRNQFATKLCRGCDRDLPLGEYYARPAANGGIRHRCKQCEGRAAAAASKRRRERKRAEAAA